jgi:pimeloyl-ACP methyl ester carboxylesterase
VLLHGLASQRRFWNLVVPDLVASGLDVLALDQRGHGDSDPSAEGYPTAAVVSDVLEVMRSQGLAAATVVGHSWGGHVAIALAAAAPERVEAVVAIDGGFAVPASGTGEERAAVRERLRPPAIALPPERLEAMLRTAPFGDRWDDGIANAVLPIFEVGDDGLARARLPTEAHMQIVDSLLDDDPFAAMAEVRCPAWLVACLEVATLDLHGQPATAGSGHGPAGWRQAKLDGLRRAASALDDARLLTWAGAVHDVPLQWPELVSGLICAAVRDRRQPPGRTGGRAP